MEENGRMEGQSRTIEWTARIVRWYRGPETKVNREQVRISSKPETCL